MPVIIPQRRQSEKRKGFAKAYASILEIVAITQDVWMKFLKKSDDSSQASPILTALQLGAVVAGLVPDAICQAVVAAIQTAAETGIELQVRKRTNTFLHQMNENLFNRRELYAITRSYRPSADPSKRNALKEGLTAGVKIEMVDIVERSDAATREGSAVVDEVQHSPEPTAVPEKDPKGFRLGVGKTQGALRLPQGAPLVFPDQILQTDGDGKTEGKMSRKREFMSSYLERRTYMHYAAKDPDSALVVPGEQRKIRSQWAQSSAQA